MKEGLLSWKFRHLYIMLYFSAFYGMFMAAVFKNFGSHKNITNDLVLTTAGAVGSVFNGSSRVFWATLQDKIGFKKVYFCVLCIQLILSSSVYWVASPKLEVLYVVYVAFSFLCLGAHFSIFPTVCGYTFGIKSGG